MGEGGVGAGPDLRLLASGAVMQVTAGRTPFYADVARMIERARAEGWECPHLDSLKINGIARVC
jgi:hypothetical protein